jgi:hypothetical protein
MSIVDLPFLRDHIPYAEFATLCITSSRKLVSTCATILFGEEMPRTSFFSESPPSEGTALVHFSVHRSGLTCFAVASRSLIGDRGLRQGPKMINTSILPELGCLTLHRKRPGTMKSQESVTINRENGLLCASLQLVKE